MEGIAERIAAATDYRTRVALYSDLCTEKRELAAELRRIDDALDALEEPLKDDFVELGQQSAKINGNTIYIKSQLWAGIYHNPETDERDYHRTVQAVEEAGLDHMVTVNTQSLSAYCREFADDTDTVEDVMAKLPEPLRGNIGLSIKLSLAARKAGK